MTRTGYIVAGFFGALSMHRATADDNFRVTAFSVGETSVCFSVAWSASQVFPDGAIDILYHPTLTFEVDEDGERDDWWYAREIPVVQSLGAASFEVSFDELLGLEEEDAVSCFFRLRISDLDGVTVGGGEGGQDEGGELPDPSTDDPVETGTAEWATLTGRLATGVEATLNESFEVVPGQVYLLAVYSYSEEFPYYTRTGSEFDDVLTWDVSLPDGSSLSGSLHVNSRHSDWQTDQANGVSVQGFSPAHLEDSAVVVVPADGGSTSGFHALTTQSQTVEVSLTAVNVSDGAYPSTVMVGLFPLKLVQSNRPNSDRATFSSTDFGMRGVVEIGVGTNAFAYITGEPAAPQLTARLDGAPASLSIDWRMIMMTERPERGTLDNRAAPAGGDWETLPGNEAWNITEALDNEIVGGKCTLYIRPQGQSQTSTEFRIRAKNPRDADAVAYLQSNAIDAEFRNLAWVIVRHESSQNKPNTIAAYRYNQFNPSGAYACLPNKTVGETGTGWGMVQIDRGNNLLLTTAEAWNWKVNVQTMNTILRAKLNTYIQHIGDYRNVFGPGGIRPSAHWSEPPATYTLENVVRSSTDWAVMTYYNGRGGLPTRKLPGQTIGIKCPFWFNEKNGGWTLKQNGKEYTKKLAKEIANPPNTVEE